MSYKTTVKTKFDIAKYMNQFVTPEVVKKMGEGIVEGIKSSLAAGFSPVRGEGRFEKYSDSYRTAIKRGLNGKTPSPVTLKSTGKMLEALTFSASGRTNEIQIGWLKPSKQTDIAGYHNEGTDRMPQRKIIPSKDEEFIVSIMRIVKDVYTHRLSAIIKKSNSR